jgi:2'-5' RNA ligase
MRLFIATSFPAAVIDPLNEQLIRLRPRLPAASWLRPETLHLTFAFLGEQPGPVVDKLVPLVIEQLAAVEKFEGRLRSCGFFPNPRHARVGWIGAQPSEKFERLAMAVREAVKDAGVELDHNEFRPHLTLMRIRDRWPPMSIETFNKAFREYESAPFTIDRITLFESKLNPKGAVHTAVREFALA